MENAASGTTPQIRVATAEQAIGWVMQGWGLFKQAPGIWIAMILIYLVVAVVLGFIPVVGDLAMALLGPVITMGWMQGARDLEAGSPLTIAHLFSGFKHPRLNNLILLGLLSLLIALGFVLVIGLGVFGAIGLSDGNQPSLGLGTLLLILLALLVILLMVAALMFATPLVGFAGVPVMESVSLSFRAALQNWLSLLVYGLIAIGLFIVGAIPLGLGLLVVFPLMIASYYRMYREIFE